MLNNALTSPLFNNENEHHGYLNNSSSCRNMIRRGRIVVHACVEDNSESPSRLPGYKQKRWLAVVIWERLFWNSAFPWRLVCMVIPAETAECCCCVCSMFRKHRSQMLNAEIHEDRTEVQQRCRDTTHQKSAAFRGRWRKG